MIKTSRQKFKYLKNEKTSQYEIKIIFHPFLRAFIEANKTHILEVQSPTLRAYMDFQVSDQCFF